MAGTTPEEIKKHVKIYISVFAALGVLTVVTVAVSYLELSFAAAVAVALFVATIKASLVACYFMHLISEKQIVYWILALTIVFFIVLLLLPLLTSGFYEASQYVTESDSHNVHPPVH